LGQALDPLHHKRHPKDMGAPEVEAFLAQLAVERKVADATQNQALSALLFLYREILHQEIGTVDSVRARKTKNMQTVLTKSEALQAINAMTGTTQLTPALARPPKGDASVARLLYGSGLRALECVRLRVKDLDFEQLLIVVRDGKGEKDRVTMLPDNVVTPLQEHLERVRQLRAKDLAEEVTAQSASRAVRPWSIPTPTVTGPGNTSTRPRVFQPSPGPAWSVVILWVIMGAVAIL
jgi:site-specific recombinase XerD